MICCACWHLRYDIFELAVEQRRDVKLTRLKHFDRTFSAAISCALLEANLFDFGEVRAPNDEIAIKALQLIITLTANRDMILTVLSFTLKLRDLLARQGAQ